ncbi:phosphatidate cytidylyltransferase, mitochondrial isoform X1 [Dermacentor albipictus]|uniref:phosphatidate cytidylyltransferase, mitochondrial isoform X1 n=2 Tax=Dermacentor albipictus TaxID=60249 RepID=UPI0038FC45BE
MNIAAILDRPASAFPFRVAALMARKRGAKRVRAIETSSKQFVSPCAGYEKPPPGCDRPRLKMAASARVVDPASWSRMLSIFPGKFSFAFCYGSAAFPQKGVTQTKSNMLDVIFAVDDPLSWHRENLKQNWKHYSFLRYGGPYLVNKVQMDFGAYVYYNTFVPYDDGLMKYGVISTDRLITDLLDWETLYLSGRLHKPVRILQEPTAEIKRAMSLNYMTAIHTALLMLPDIFTEEELYLKIAGLSYVGDFRMIVGEDKNKVANIVGAQLSEFRKLYNPYLKLIKMVSWNEATQTFEQEPGPDAKLHHLNLLPKSLQSHLLKVWNKDGRHRDLEDVLQAIGHDPHCSVFIEEAVASIVWRSSWGQTAKGIITAGLWSAIHYGSKKVIKMLKSLTTTQPSLKT